MSTLTNSSMPSAPTSQSETPQSGTPPAPNPNPGGGGQQV